MNKETAIQALKTLQQEIADKKKALRPLFENGLRELFASQQPAVKSVEVRINNHEFNDGDATYFGFYYDDLGISFSDGTAISDYNGDEGAVTDQHRAAQAEFVKFFGEFDVDGFYETLYGDAYESLTFTCENGKVTTS